MVSARSANQDASTSRSSKKGIRIDKKEIQEPLKKELTYSKYEQMENTTASQVTKKYSNRFDEVLDLKLNEALGHENNFILIKTESYTSKKFNISSRNSRQGNGEIVSFRNNSIKDPKNKYETLRIGDIRYSGFKNAHEVPKTARGPARNFDLTIGSPQTHRVNNRGYDLNGFPGGKFISQQQEKKKVSLMQKTRRNAIELSKYF